MEQLKLLFSLIDDELSDAMKYASKAVHCKGTKSGMAELFYSLSIEELKHKNMLHNQLIKEMDDYIAAHPEKEAEIDAIYDVMDERQVEWENSIRIYQSTYRE